MTQSHATPNNKSVIVHRKHEVGRKFGHQSVCNNMVAYVTAKNGAQISMQLVPYWVFKTLVGVQKIYWVLYMLHHVRS